MKKSNYANLSPLEKLDEALEAVRRFDPKLRPPNSDRKPGGLIEFQEGDDREFIIIGDLHANKRNLKYILLDDGNLRKLQEDRLVIIFLGDIIHDDRTGYMNQMDSSIEILEVVLHLIQRYPRNIVYLLGNHDTFSEYLAKLGIQQGLLFRQAVLDRFGPEYVDKLQEFFDALPVFVKHPHFLVTHAGPPRGGATRDELINIDHFKDLKWQVTWNRLNETRTTPSLKEYGNEDLVELRSLLKCPPEIPVIVGHNPMWKWGGDDSIWINPAGTKNHVILYSNLPKKCPYLSFNGSMQYTVKYADLRLVVRRFVLDDYA